MSATAEPSAAARGVFELSRGALEQGRGDSSTELLATRIVASPDARMFCITGRPGVYRRHDLWFADAGTVIHSRVAHASDRSPGTVVRREASAAALAALIARALDGLPCVPHSGRTSLPSVDDLLPAVVRSDVATDRALVLGAEQPDGSVRYLAGAQLHRGGVLATFTDPEQRLRLDPAAAPEMWAAIVRLLP